MAKKFLSAIMALSMAVCTFAGCSDLDKDGNLKEAFSYKTVTTINEDIEFKIRSDFKEIEDKTYVYSYNNDIEFSIAYIHDIERMSKDVCIDIYNESYKWCDNCYYEVIDCGDYEVITFLFGDEGEKYNSEFMVYKKDDQYSGFSVLAEYPDKESEEIVRKLALEIIESGEYIGEAQEPRKTEYECDYFSVKFPDYLDYLNIRYANDNSVVIDYYEIFKKAMLNSRLTVEAIPDSEYKSAEEYVKAEWDAEIEEIKEVEILGYDGYCFEKTKGTYEKEYAFDKDGIIYSILINVDNADGHEQVEADFEKLIDCIKIK